MPSSPSGVDLLFKSAFPTRPLGVSAGFTLSRMRSWGGIAFDLIRRKRSDGEERKKASERLALRLGSLQGIPQKVGQLLGFSELLEEAPVFLSLTENEKTFEAAEILSRVSEELGESWTKHFISIESEGIVASIGQVHRGRLHGGREVAIKLQYPKVAEAIRTDLQLLGWGIKLKGGFDRIGYQGEVNQMLQGELDYRLEAEWGKKFANHASEVEWLKIPQVIEGRPRLLIQEWMAGERVAESFSWNESERLQLSERLLRLFFLQIFSWNFFHADPNPGNYRVRREEGSVILLDFGCVKCVDLEFKSALQSLLRIPEEEGISSETAYAALIQAGFNAVMLEPFRERLGEMMELLLEPLRSKAPYDWGKWNLRARSEALLQEHRMAFRLAGPPGLLYWIRALQGLSSFLIALNVPVIARNQWEDLIGRDASPACPDLTSGQAGEPSLPRVDKSVVRTDHHRRESMSAEFMHILVMERGERKVSLTYDATSAEYLSQLMPLEMKQRLDARGINLHQIETQAKASEFQAGELFHWEEGEKQVRVWLE